MLVYLEDAVFPRGICVPLFLPQKLSVWYRFSFGILTAEPQCSFWSYWKNFFCFRKKSWVKSFTSNNCLLPLDFFIYFFLLYTLATNERVVNSCTEECTRNLDENNCHKTKELFQFSEKTEFMWNFYKIFVLENTLKPELCFWNNMVMLQSNFFLQLVIWSLVFLCQLQTGLPLCGCNGLEFSFWFW